jgi:hypothetical protein
MDPILTATQDEFFAKLIREAPGVKRLFIETFRFLSSSVRS